MVAMSTENASSKGSPAGPPNVPSSGSGESHERFYQMLFELLPCSVVLLDARGVVLDANTEFCRHIGFARAELRGLHVSRFSQDSVETIERNIARMMAGAILEHTVTN